jgi:hypothetical protein
MRQLAALYRVSEDALARHKAAHLPQMMVRAYEEGDVRHAIDIFQQLQAINAATFDILLNALQAGDHNLTLKAIDRVHRQIELQARLLGELAGEATQVNLLLAPQWVIVRSALLDALSPFPEARVAVAERLATLEGEGV